MFPKHTNQLAVSFFGLIWPLHLISFPKFYIVATS